MKKKLSTGEEFERALGSPFDSGDFSFRQIVSDDDREVFPEERVSALVDLGINEFAIPHTEEGKFISPDSSIEVLKAIGRRDMTSLIAIGKNFLGALPFWMFGTPEKKSMVAAELRAGSLVSLGLTERGSGSDLLSVKTTAEESQGSWKISGEKWLINNIERAKLVTVLAKTNSSGGPKGLSLIYFDPTKISSGEIISGGKIRTHGVRGMALGSLKFNGFTSFSSGNFGSGDGFAQTMKVMQVSRTLCSTLSLGGAETCLRLVTEFALNRRLYGRALSDSPVIKHRLVKAWARLQLAEIVSYFSTRSMSLFPEELSLHSALAKYFIPLQCEEILRELAVIFGARNYLREGWYDGIFEKCMRDVPLVSLFDGSSQVNLYVIANQLPQLLSPGAGIEDGKFREEIFRFDRPLPGMDFSKLRLTNRGECFLLRSIDEGNIPGADELQRILKALREKLAADDSEIGRMKLAEEFCHLIVLAAASFYKSPILAIAKEILFSGKRPEDSEIEAHFIVLANRVKNDENLGIVPYKVASFYGRQAPGIIDG